MFGKNHQWILITDYETFQNFIRNFMRLITMNFEKREEQKIDPFLKHFFIEFLPSWMASTKSAHIQVAHIHPPFTLHPSISSTIKIISIFIAFMVHYFGYNGLYLDVDMHCCGLFCMTTSFSSAHPNLLLLFFVQFT